MKIGLGIITYNRPEYFAQAMAGIKKHLYDRVDYIIAYRDGGKYEAEYDRIMCDYADKVIWINKKENKGVAAAKNFCLQAMMEAGCDYLFVSEDDVVVQNRGAVVQYIATAVYTGCHNLMFAHHGDGNANGPIVHEAGFEIYGNCVGAWVMYTRQAIEAVGYMDETFHNAFEHMEHTHRIVQADMAPAGGYMDVKDSTDYIREIPGSLQNSSIRSDKKWVDNMRKGLRHWKVKDPNFPMQHVLDVLEQKNA